MSNVIQFPKQNERRAAEIESNILQAMSHPNSKTLERWRELCRPYIQKYIRPPERTQPGLSLPIPASATEVEQQAIVDAVRSYVVAYNEDVERHVMLMLGDIVLLQKKIAESET